MADDKSEKKQTNKKYQGGLTDTYLVQQRQAKSCSQIYKINAYCMNRKQNKY